MNRKILLTGKPRSGKTTLLKKIIERFDQKQGFLTEEVRESGERTVFQIITAGGESALLASVKESSLIRVSKYSVIIENLDRVLPSLTSYLPNDTLYIDEIGEMELYSESFKNLVENYLDSGNPFIGTISSIYSDDFTKRILARRDISVLEITQGNRESVYQQILQLIK